MGAATPGSALWRTRLVFAAAVVVSLVTIRLSVILPHHDSVPSDREERMFSPFHGFGSTNHTTDAARNETRQPAHDPPAVPNESPAQQSPRVPPSTPAPSAWEPATNPLPAAEHPGHGSVSRGEDSMGHRRFDDFTTNLARGANIMTSISGCHIAAWIYFTSPKRRSPDCGDKRTSKAQLWRHEDNTPPVPEGLEPYDTVFVHKRMVVHFVEMTLPHVKVPIVLLTGSYENSQPFDLRKHTIEGLVSHPMIEAWFCQNVHDLTKLPVLPPKVYPLALGVEPFGKHPKKHPNPAAVIRDTILRLAASPDGGTAAVGPALPFEKTIGVFEAYLSPHTNPNRENVPRGTKLPLPEYLERLARSRFVLSPDGHRPDCFRHYEALGFGAIPVTELNPDFYGHLRAGPVVYGNTQWWNLTEEAVLAMLNASEAPIANRNLIFEEYWMEDIDRRVGRPLRWYDGQSQKRAHLEDFELFPEDIPFLIRSAQKDYSPNSTRMLQNYLGERSARRKQKEVVRARTNQNADRDGGAPTKTETKTGPRLLPGEKASDLEKQQFRLWQKALRELPAPPKDFNPRKFDNFTNNLARGANVMTSISACHFACWIYMVGKNKKNTDCSGHRSTPMQQFNLADESLPDFRPYDTIFVHQRMVKDFSNHILPNITVPIVLLTSSYKNILNNRVTKPALKRILESPLVDHWFVQNIQNSTGLSILPANVHPMALGVEPFGKDPALDTNPALVIRDALLRYADALPYKSIGVFEAYTSPYTNPNRMLMPRGTKMPLPDYLEHLAKSKFVLSPNGHKPDCFRHYEAYAFGAVPITELDPILYSHLKAGPTVFNNTNWWNLTETQILEQMNLTAFPNVNRNLVFEEYWMEDMERIVGRPLRWFDSRRKTPSTLEDLYLNHNWIPKMIDSAWADYSKNSSMLLQKFKGERKSLKRKRLRIPLI